MRRILQIAIAVVVAMTAISVWAKDFYAGGLIFDAETNQRIWGSTITVINASTGKILSKQVDAAPDNIITDGDRKYLVQFWAVDGDTFDVRYRVTHPEYKTDSVSFQFPRDFNGYQVQDTIWLVKNDCELDAQTLIRLREVTVTATKVKMVMNGDTIVYNADAFNLPEGSLLDALVSQLPGVTLNSQGQIRVNGEYVSSLLIDGKKFFQGDPSVALNNLPAYTVKKVKVYRHDEYRQYKNPDEAERSELPLVMDVKLKPQYQKGAFGNVGVGYGTSGRYLARAFGMEYVRNFSLVAYAQANNINSDASAPPVNGAQSWEEAFSNTGRRQTVKTGVDLAWSTEYKHENKPYSTFAQLGGTLTYQHSRTRLVTRTASTSFMPDGDIYSRSSSNELSRRDRANFNMSGMFNMVPTGGKTVLDLFPRANFSFTKVDNTTAQQAAEFDYEPTGSISAVLDSTFTAVNGATGTAHNAIYHSSYDPFGLTRDYNASASLLMVPNIVNDEGYPYKRFRPKFTIDWNFGNSHTNSHNQRLIYYNTPDTILSRQFAKNFSGHWAIGAQAQQEIRSLKLGAAYMTIFLTERYDYSHYRGRQDMHQTDNPFASMQEAAIDAANTYYSDETNNKGTLVGAFRISKGFNWANLQLRGEAINSHLLYTRGDIDADVSRLRWKFEPSLTAQVVRNSATARNKFALNAALLRTLPSLTTLLATTDNTNPLAIYLGNPDLKTASTLNVGVSYERTPASSRFITKLSLGHDYYWNRRSTHRSYNSTTGVSTYKPVNVSGAYDLRGALDITAKLDHDNRLWLTSSTSATYEHIPDWMQENGGDDVLSTVRNTLLSENIRLNWTIRSGYSLTFGVNATWRNATSPMASFTTINAADIAAKLAAQIQLPWKLQLGTDMTLYKRCGYGDASLNDASWVWNANLTRSFLSGRFLASVTAFDILGQLSNISASINSLGRTETWTNSLRRYAMLTLTYRFSLMPHSANN